MEKGSFHASQLGFQSPTKEADERVKSIPLPNQLPKGMDFSDIPVTAFKSSTLDTLISQNEDLMARLSVALRKSNEQEDKIVNYERENQTLRTRFETLKDQYLVIQEKDRLSNHRTTALHDDNVELKVKISKLEKMYSDIFVQAQALQRRLMHLERYRARVRKAADGMRSKVQEIKRLKAEAVEHETKHTRIVQLFETQVVEARTQADTLREKAAERDRLYYITIELENQLVLEQRQNSSFREDVESRLTKVTEEAANLRLQLKETLIDRESKQQEAESLRASLPSLMQSNSNLTEQVESLQALWSHKQREFETLNERNKSLQKLNQSISLNLNQQRKEIHSLQQELEKERFQWKEQFKTLMLEIQMLRGEQK